MLTSCSSNDKYDFKDSSDAIETYHEYLVSVRNIKTSNTDDFSKEVSQWNGYKKFIQHRYKGGNYLAFLKRIRYAEDPGYIRKVAKIANRLYRDLFKN